MNEVLCERHDGWAEVILNRPERRNAIDGPLAEGMLSTLLALNADDSIRAIVLRGAGGALCSGLDLKAFSAEPAPEWLAGFNARWSAVHQALLDTSQVLVVALELPSLTVQADDFSMTNLVASSLFGDGAAACVVTDRPRTGAKILSSQSYLFPDSYHFMGFDTSEKGFNIVLEGAGCAPSDARCFTKWEMSMFRIMMMSALFLVAITPCAAIADDAA